MKKIRRRFLMAVLAVMFAFLLCSCGKSADTLNGVSFLEDTITVEKYETYALSLLGAEGKDITWKSKDESKAVVVDGVVYAKKKGSTVISACIGKESISCEVVISDNQYVPSIELNEPEEGVNLEQEQTYSLAPLLTYNGNTYTDAEYSYSVVGDSIKIDDKGTITAKELGENIVCVKAKWRGAKIETTLPIQVIDASTSIEVCDKNFDIYLNGDGGEFPSKADLGILIFDKDVQVKNAGSAVKYVEEVLEGDTSEAVKINDGVAHANKLGTIHYIAQYTAKSGEVFESTNFSITVHKSPKDIYMTPIYGEEYEFFFEAIDKTGVNSVKWDDKMKAYHLSNKWLTEGDSRGFIINQEYLNNILKYTDIEVITFEIKSDGVQSGIQEKNPGKKIYENLYQGFWPSWYIPTEYKALGPVDDWTEVEINIRKLPKDAKGNPKTVFLLHATQGMYIRDVKFYLPGADRTGYDPNHNYLEAIQGEEYEFFIKPVDTTKTNSVEWDEKKQAYHLVNKWLTQGTSRGFIFDKNYLTNIIRHTDADRIAFEVKYDGIQSGIKDVNGVGVYDRFHLGYWTGVGWTDGQIYADMNYDERDWVLITINLADIPVDENGTIRTIMLLHETQGLYVKNIKLYRPGEKVIKSVRDTGYDPNHNYLEPIQGEEYKFFVKPFNKTGVNSVEWDEEKKAYHLVNKWLTLGNDRGFLFDKDYMTNIIKYTDADRIAFEVRNDGVQSGIKDVFNGVYDWIWTGYNTPEEKAIYTDLGVCDWRTVVINLADVPVDSNGVVSIPFFILHECQGMYIRNIRVYCEGEEIPNPVPDTGYDPNHNYLEQIQGEEYEFFIEPIDTTGVNSVEWDESKQAYHLANKWLTQGTSRGFLFDRNYLTNIIQYTDADRIAFEVKYDGIQSGLKDMPEGAGTYDRFHLGYWTGVGWTDGQIYADMNYSGNDWALITINLADIPRDSDGYIRTILLLHETQGLYVKNIKLYRPGEEIPNPAPDTGNDPEDEPQDRPQDNPNYNWLTPIQGEEYEFFIKPNSTDNSVEWDETKQAYHLKNSTTGAGNGRAFLLDMDYIASIIEHTDAESITFEVENDGALVANGQQYDYLYQAYDLAWGSFEWTGYHPEVRSYTVELKLADIPKDADGNLKQFALMHSRQGMYVKNITINVPAKNYLAPIQGKEYEFFISPNSTENSVEWDETEQAYHLKNLTTGAGNGRAFIFDTEYITNVIKYTNAETLTFEVRNDGALVQNGQLYDYLYQAYDMAWGAYTWTGYHPAICDWIQVEIKLADIPKDADGNLKLFAIMHSRQGMYVRNITFNAPEEPTQNYLAPIQGEEYEFFISPNSTENSVEWDEMEQAYHLKNLTTGAGNGRAFIFDTEYIANVIKYTNAETLTFEVRNDGALVQNGQLYDYLYQAYDMAWGAYKWTGYHPAICDWIKVEINLADIPKDADGNLKLFAIMHSRQGMYVRNITFNAPEEPTQNYLAAIQGEEYEFFISPNVDENSVEWDETEQAYHLKNLTTGAGNGRAFIFDTEYIANVIKYTNAETLTFEVRNDGVLVENGQLYDYLYQAYDMAWGAYTWTGYHPAICDWIQVEIKLADIPKDAEEKLKLFAIMHSRQGMYVRNIKFNTP